MTKNKTIFTADGDSTRKARRRYYRVTGIKVEGTNLPRVEYPNGRKIMRAMGRKKLSEIYGN